MFLLFSSLLLLLLPNLLEKKEDFLVCCTFPLVALFSSSSSGGELTPESGSGGLAALTVSTFPPYNLSICFWTRFPLPPLVADVGEVASAAESIPAKYPLSAQSCPLLLLLPPPPLICLMLLRTRETESSVCGGLLTGNWLGVLAILPLGEVYLVLGEYPLTAQDRPT